MSKIRMAVVGGGHLGRIHAKLLSSLDDVALVGVVEPSGEARELLEAQGVQTHFDDVGALEGKVDAVVIAAPTALHRRLASQLIDANIDVLVEKPLATTLEDAESLAQQADARAAILQVGHVERFNPAFEAALGHCDQPKFISGVRSGPFTFRCTDVGVVLDLMIHDIELVLAAVDSQVQRLDAHGMSVLSMHEDVADARITFENGCVAQLHASRVALEPERRMTIFCADRQVIVDFGARTTTLVQFPAQSSCDWDQLSVAQRTAKQNSLFTEILPVRTLEIPEQNALLEELKDFVRSVRSRRQPRVTGRHACQAMAVAEAICDCIGRKTTVSIPLPTANQFAGETRRQAG